MPWGTLALAAVAFAALMMPTLGDAVALDRGLVRSGAWWRLFTGHFHHFSALHFSADAAGLLVFAGWLEMRDRRVWAWAMGLTLMGSGPLVLLLEPGLSRYGGMSALVHAGAAALASQWIREGTVLERWAGVGVLAWIWAGLAGWTDSAVLPEGIQVCRTAHGAGAAAGLLASGWISLRFGGGARDELPLGTMRVLAPTWSHAAGHRQWPVGAVDLSRHA